MIRFTPVDDEEGDREYERPESRHLGEVMVPEMGREQGEERDGKQDPREWKYRPERNSCRGCSRARPPLREPPWPGRRWLQRRRRRVRREADRVSTGARYITAMRARKITRTLLCNDSFSPLMLRAAGGSSGMSRTRIRYRGTRCGAGTDFRQRYFMYGNASFVRRST